MLPEHLRTPEGAGVNVSAAALAVDLGWRNEASGSDDELGLVPALRAHPHATTNDSNTSAGAGMFLGPVRPTVSGQAAPDER
jgi:hypothetical protein